MIFRKNHNFAHIALINTMILNNSWILTMLTNNHDFVNEKYNFAQSYNKRSQKLLLKVSHIYFHHNSSKSNNHPSLSMLWYYTYCKAVRLWESLLGSFPHLILRVFLSILLFSQKPIFVDVAKANARAIHIYEKYGFVENTNPTKSVMATLPSGKQIENFQMIRPAKAKQG